ncbi:HAD-like domain-containing protein [Panaeolus papilionaceus]|nr:HAD-like domain-containing protein [Panaeolus papilionaceus]
MLGIFARSATRSIPRGAFAQTARCMSQKPPVPPKKRLEPAEKPETASASSSSAESSSSPKTEEPAELAEGPTKTGLGALDFSPVEIPHEQEKRTGARSSKDSLSTGERKRRFMSRVSLALMLAGLGTYAVYMGRDWEEDELRAKKMRLEDAPATRWGRTTERFTEIFDVFSKPAWPELLPPPYPTGIQKPYTLLVDIEDLLVSSTWDRQHGWRTAKRPGVDYFLGYLSQFYEVVIFTTAPSHIGTPIVDKLDPYVYYIGYRLFREATRSLDGKVVKDLSYLNRDLSKVIMMDTNPEHVITHPENSIIIPPWKGDPKDKGLVAMIPFLESIAIYKPADVRPILKAYEGKNIPLEYGKMEAEMKAKHVAEWKAKHKPSVVTPSFGSLFGLSSSTPAQSKNEPPPTYLELRRREAQAQYLHEQNYIKENKEEIEKGMQQEQAAMAAQAPGSLWAAMDQLRAGGPAAPPPPPGESTPTPAQA